MPSLLNPSEFAEIRAALKDVLDTFATTPIILRVTDDISLDPFNENRSLSYTDYALNAQVEYNNGYKSKDDPNFAGQYDRADVKVKVHLDYLEDAGLMSNDYPTFSPNTTKLIIDNDGVKERYAIDHVSVDGALGKKQTYCMILAKRDVIKAT